MKHFFFKTFFFLIVSMAATSIGVGLLIEFYVDQRYPVKFLHENRELSKGTFYLLEQELLKGTEQQYATVINRLQPRFGYPIEVETFSNLELTEAERLTLAEGNIIIWDEGDIHLKAIGTSNFILVAGPYQYFQPKLFEIMGFLIIACFVFGLMLFGWSIYFWQRLNRVSRATLAFGEGKFDTRVVVSKYSSLAPIASTFNSMAGQIERLISSHKQLVDAVSHELRTPISRIRFGLESVRAAEESQRISHLSGIRHDVDELDDLVNELLSYARFERMENRMSLKNIPLLPWFREYMQVAEEISEVPLKFTWQGITEESVVAFDPRQLERVIHNLLQNGSRFAVQLIHLKIVRGKKWVTIIVEDDGPGIERADWVRVFDPFIRLDSSRNRENGGYGLGLSIVREIARSHNGSISVQRSTLGGAAFYLKLPAEEIVS